MVGHPPAPNDPVAVSEEKHRSLLLRADWTAFIQAYLHRNRTDMPTPTIISHLKWENHEEYEQGISRLWLRRVSSEGDAGSAKRAVAFRYVLACIVGNRYVLASARSSL